VTHAAIRYCSAKHIELLISDDAATFISLFASEPRADARRTAFKVREQQFKSGTNLVAGSGPGLSWRLEDLRCLLNGIRRHKDA
jgi:hypothetical protein